MLLWLIGGGLLAAGAYVVLGGDESEGGDEPEPTGPDDLDPSKPWDPSADHDPPRPEPVDVPLDPDAGWPNNVVILKTAAQFQAWGVAEVVEGEQTMKARATVYFGYSPDWKNLGRALTRLRHLTAQHDEVRFIVFSFADSRAAFGQPDSEMAYVATAAGPMGEIRPNPFFAKRLVAKNISRARWLSLIDYARLGPVDSSTSTENPPDGDTGNGGIPDEDDDDDVPTSGNYGPNAQTVYIGDHPRGPHWVATVCNIEQLPDQKVLRCSWYLWIGKHATTLAQADFASTDTDKAGKLRPWAGALASRPAALAKAIDFIDDYAIATATGGG